MAESLLVVGSYKLKPKKTKNIKYF